MFTRLLFGILNYGTTPKDIVSALIEEEATEHSTVDEGAPASQPGIHKIARRARRESENTSGKAVQSSVLDMGLHPRSAIGIHHIARVEARPCV